MQLLQVELNGDGNLVDYGSHWWDNKSYENRSLEPDSSEFKCLKKNDEKYDLCGLGDIKVVDC